MSQVFRGLVRRTILGAAIAAAFSWLAAGCSDSAPGCGDCSVLDDWCQKGVCDAAQGKCVAEPLADDLECKDGDPCTVGDHCQAGRCVGTPLDCTAEEDECVQGVCQDEACQYQPRPDGTPCPSAAGACTDGECRSGICQAVNHSNGESCNDGNWCTDPDTCQEGVCAGAPRDCGDLLDCTHDRCDPERNACVHEPLAGTCLIGGVCRAEGEANPENPCQACKPTANQSAFSDDDGRACDDGNVCTGPDTCAGGNCFGPALAGCCETDADCDDGRACTADVCHTADGTCENGIRDGFCLIGNACILEGVLNPENGCQACLSAVHKTAWSDTSAACDDGFFCTANDRCSGGSCAGQAGVVCADSLECTDDVCSEAGQVCSHPVRAGFCLIAGVCVVEGAPHPSNPCRRCRPALDPDDWSNDDSAVCDDGNRCTDPDFCNQGACTGIPLSNCCTANGDCDDGRECTEDRCDVANGICENVVQPERCLIAGTCYAAGQVNPANPCQACLPAVASTAWSPANEGGRCGLICSACRNGACQSLPDTGADPFGDCPTCRVCDGQGGCRPTADGTDPKNDCVASDCSYAECWAGSCLKPAGSVCPDPAPLDCRAARCDGVGVCDPNYALELPGYACDDGDPCSAPDRCDSSGQCLGAALAPLPDPASPIAATSACLTAESGARAVVSVRLRTAANQPIPGASVTIEGDSPATRWAGPVVESAAVPGTYYRILLAPAGAGSTRITASAFSGSGSCTSPVVALSGSVMVRFVAPSTAGLGGCSPLDGNLRVRVVAAESGLPLSGAYLMVGTAQSAAFEDDYERLLAGQPPARLNTARADGNGTAEFTDFGTGLDGPRMITAGLDGRAYVSVVEANASDVIIPLPLISDPPPMARLDGTLTNMGNVNYDGQFDAGLTITEFGIDSLVKFRFDDMLAGQRDCWLATDAAVVGAQWVEMPSNVYVPAQSERYLVIFNIPIYEHRYTTRPIPIGATNQRIVGISGRAAFSTLVDLLMNGGSLADMVALLTTRRIGVISRATITGDEHNVPIALGTALTANVDCSIANKPAGSDALCFTIGDWSGGTGAGSLFVMGFRVLSGGTGSVTSVPASGSFAGIGYLGAGVATYLNADNLPAQDRWKANATSGILDRSGTSFNGGGGALTFNSFLEVTPLSRSGRTFAWASVATSTPVHFTEHLLELVTSTRYVPGPNCSEVSEDVWRRPLWKVITPGATLGFTLPDLPPGWPRQAEGGLATPAAGERLSWSFGAYFQGLLGTPFDFNQFDFARALSRVTHSSTNSADF